MCVCVFFNFAELLNSVLDIVLAPNPSVAAVASEVHNHSGQIQTNTVAT